MTKPRVRPSSDIRPLSEFRANIAAYIEQVRDSGRPLVLTQNGRGAAVVLGVEQYEQICDEVELVRDVKTAENQIAAGKGVSHSRAKAELRRRLK
ncbi:MAG: type II toxin-antitoxin system Phd/YefM family antitoxin [Gemmatimonadales bacterium]